MIMNLEKIFKKDKSLKSKIYPIKLHTLYIKNNNSSESKKDDNNFYINQSISQSILNSNRFITNYDESFYDSKKLHLIKKPYKVFLPIRTKIKKIRKTRALSFNNYYKKAIRNEFILKDIVATDSFNAINNKSKTLYKKSPKMRVLKSTVELSNSNQNNASKNAFMSTERTSTVKDINNMSKYNNYDRFKIFSYKCKENYKNHNISYNHKLTKNNESNTNANEIYNEYKILKFLNMNQGYKNLPSLKNCINNFTNEIKNLTREKYMNYCLRENEATLKARTECNNDKFKMEMKKKMDNKNLFDIFFNDYNTYFNRLSVKKMKDTDYISLLKWEIISYKNEVNRLNIKKDKLLARLNKYIKMKYFLITMQNYSLDKKDDSWKFHSSKKNANEYTNLIKEKRRIVTPEEHRIESGKKFKRRVSVDNNMGNMNKMSLYDDKNKRANRKLKRVNSSHESNPLAASAIKEIATILNNHIANLLIYNNQLRNDLEPLKEEFDSLYNSLKLSDEKKNQLLKLEFIIYPEKKRIVKDRNDFLRNTLFNLKNIIYNTSKYNKMNKLLQDKLYKIYKTLLDNNIIPLTYLKASINDNIIEQILFYLKNIEKGLSVLFGSKRKIREEYPDVYNEIIKEIHLEIKIRTLEAQRKMESKLKNKQLNKIADRMKKSIFLIKRKDYYEYGYIRKKEKKEYKKMDPYEELRYSVDEYNSVKNE